MENEFDYDLDHVRTYLKYAFLLNYLKIALYCEMNQKNLSDFVQKEQNGKPVGLVKGKKELFKFFKLETTYDPKVQWVKLKERTKIVAGPSEFLTSIIIVAT